MILCEHCGGREKMNKEFLDAIEANPIIAAVKDEQGLQNCLGREELTVIFILYGDIRSIGGIVERIHQAGKIAIREYKGIAFGEVITGVNFMKDLGAGLRNFFGGRSAGYEEELQKARGEALAELEQRAGAMGANAVIGVDIDYEVLGADNGMLMVTASGTAVVVD